MFSRAMQWGKVDVRGGLGSYPIQVMVTLGLCFAIGKMWWLSGHSGNNSNIPSTGELISKMWSIHAMDCYLAIKRNEVPEHTTSG